MSGVQGIDTIDSEELLQRTVKYWRDCIKNEDLLEKGVSIYTRKKAVLYPFSQDPFIFVQNPKTIPIEEEKLVKFHKYIETRDFEAYYGYPVLFYEDKRDGIHKLAPLFILGIRFEHASDQLVLTPSEQLPNCGIRALKELGLKTDAVSQLNKDVKKIFAEISNNKKQVREILRALDKKSPLPLREEIDPGHLTSSTKLRKKDRVGIFNKSLIFADETNTFNIHLLEDLENLSSKNDLSNTGLQYLIKKDPDGTVEFERNTPIIYPFPANEYQLASVNKAVHQDLTVVTGPPGTGKSQFISNLLINVFLRGESALFVSHTNEAVDVVQENLSEYFKHLIFRTGNKTHREAIKTNFQDALQASSTTMRNRASRIKEMWRRLLGNRRGLVNLANLENKLSEIHRSTHLPPEGGLLGTMKNLWKQVINKLELRYVLFKIAQFPSANELKTRIEDLDRLYCQHSREFVRQTYLNEMLGPGTPVGDLKSFIDYIDRSSFRAEAPSRRKIVEVTKNLRLWSSTLKSLRGSFPLYPNLFDYVIFDEASQVDLPSAAPALYRGKKVVVVGDEMQLSHIPGFSRDLDEMLADEYSLREYDDYYKDKICYYTTSLYRSASNSLNSKPIFLRNHYRSESEIYYLTNKTFYGGSLKLMSVLDNPDYPKDLSRGVKWVNCAGKVLRSPQGSRYNEEEAIEVVRVFRDVIKKIGGTSLDIGVVSPYTGQTSLIYDKISSEYSDEKLEEQDVKILTAHKFQGSEKDIMIFSPVLASDGNANNDWWYNNSQQIINVALSRAKYLLYIVGDKNFFKNHICGFDDCILRRLVNNFDEIKEMTRLDYYSKSGRIDSLAERKMFRIIGEVMRSSCNDSYDVIPKPIVDGYTLDFGIFQGDRKVNIECDGGQHEMIGGLPVIDDVERDKRLRAQGWEIVRFSNHKIFEEPSYVYTKLLQLF